MDRWSIADYQKNLREDVRAPCISREESVCYDRDYTSKIPLLERPKAHCAPSPHKNCDWHQSDAHRIHCVENARAEIGFFCNDVRCKTQACSQKKGDPHRERGSDLTLSDLIHVPSEEDHLQESDGPHAEVFHRGILQVLFLMYNVQEPVF